MCVGSAFATSAMGFAANTQLCAALKAMLKQFDSRSALRPLDAISAGPSRSREIAGRLADLLQRADHRILMQAAVQERGLVHAGDESARAREEAIGPWRRAQP